METQKLLGIFSEQAKAEGDALVRAGAVTGFQTFLAGSSYVVHVTDRREFRVFFDLVPGWGWITRCTCSQTSACPHTYAATRVLMREGAQGFDGGQAGGTSAKQPEENLREILKRSLGRKLHPDESRFISTVEDAYRSARSMGAVTNWMLSRMGFYTAYGSWGELEVFPSMPKSAYEFWLYVAHYLTGKGQGFPEFMDPITDFSVIEPELGPWKRKKEIQQWQSVLSHVDHPITRRVEARPLELRLLLDTNRARLQSREAENPTFHNIGRKETDYISSGLLEGAVELDERSYVLWGLVTTRDRVSATLSYEDPDDSSRLAKILRSPRLADMVVNRFGKPLERGLPPLKWKLAEPGEQTDDYRLTLEDDKGQPPPKAIFVCDGRPSLLLTEQSLVAGPPLSPQLLSYSGTTTIPREVVESPQGVRFLLQHDIELPAKLKQRVRYSDYNIQIKCSLVADRYSGAEECLFAISASSEQGRTLSWSSSKWIEQHPARPCPDGICIEDETNLRKADELLSTLNLKPSYSTSAPALRVNKQFGETFSRWLKALPPFIHVQLDGELASLTSADVAGRVKLDVQEAGIDWFDLSVVLDVSDTTLSQQEIRLLLNARGSFVRLKGKGWRRLQFDISQEEDEKLARIGLSPRELSAEPQRIHALQLADNAARKLLPDEQVDRIERRASEIRARISPALPPTIKAELRPYQMEGFHFLAYLSSNRFGGILADDMGLGKTLQTLAWLVWLRENTGVGDSAPGERTAACSLVVCPKSVADNWKAEAERFAPTMKVRVWSASDMSSFAEEVNQSDLHVVNYAQLRLQDTALGKVRWLALILDEGQYIKNPNSQTAQSARALKAEHRLILSGTPIENRLMDLWSLMAFAMPGVLGNRAQFGRVYDSKEDPLARRRLSSRVRPFLLRRTKGQVAKDLPDKIEEELFCEMEGEQLALYKAELKNAQQRLLSVSTQKELAAQQFNFLTSLLRLRQICCHPKLAAPGSNGISAKTEMLLEQLEPLMEEGHKVLVFSQFVEMLQLLEPVLQERGWNYFYLAGETENRGDLVKRFQSAEGGAVFLISLKAGGFGLNLTAASYVVLFDPWWNPAVENQAIDRTHRIGQQNKVIAYRLLIKNSVEEKIRALQKSKRALAEDVLGEERFSQSLTLDDLRFLLSD